MTFRTGIGPRHIFYVAVISSIFFFQNCSDPSDSNSLDASSSVQESLPFAYNATIDTLAYMSCSNIQDSSYTPRAYFSFRAGAYNPATGGLSMTPAFFENTQYDTPTTRGQSLSQSFYNSNIMLGFSIRNVSNYQNLWGSTSPTAGMDLDTFLPQLDGNLIAGQLASLTATNVNINYFPGNSTQRLMEASLRFFDSETDATNTRNQLGSNASILVAGYTSTADVQDQTLRSPIDFLADVGTTNSISYPTSASNANTIYGVGYQFNFSLPAGYSTGDRRVISPSVGITEKNLLTGLTQASTWTCPSTNEFMIVRPEDVAAGLVICHATVDTTANAAQAAELRAIRRVLRVEDWYVDLNYHCVIPKGTGDYCYGAAIDQAASGTVAPVVQYGTTACADTATTLCPHFVSVCTRN